MYASRWKFKLLKKYNIKFLPIVSIENDDVQKDMERTFPSRMVLHTIKK